MSDQSTEDQRNLLKRNLDLEELKLKLDYRKFLWGGVFVALAVAAIPPGFQMGAAVIEYVKAGRQLEIDQANKKADRDAQQQVFRDTYVKEFINNAMNQDIELRIRFAEYFAFVSTDRDGWIAYKDELFKRRKAIREQIDAMEKQWQQKVQLKDASQADLEQLERNLAWAYKEVGYVERNRSVAANPRVPDPKAVAGGAVSAQTLSQLFEPLGQRKDEVQLVLDAFGKRCTNDPDDMAIYLAIILHESGFLRSRRVESFQYSAAQLASMFSKFRGDVEKARQVASGGEEAIANYVYEGVLGNKEPGDGWRYRGRGYVMATGRDNYRKLDSGLSLSGLLEKEPDRLSDPKLAIEASAFLVCEAIAASRAPDKSADLARTWRRIYGSGTLPSNLRMIHDRIRGGN